MVTAGQGGGGRVGGGGVLSVHDKWSDPRRSAARANDAARAMVQQAAGGGQWAPSSGGEVPWQPGQPRETGWYGPDWQHGRSPEEKARLHERFNQFMPKLSSGGGGGRAQDFFDQLLPPGAQLAPNAGAGYAGAQRVHYDLRRGGRVGSMNMPGGAQLSMGGGGGGGNSPLVTSQQSYRPEFATQARQNYPINRNEANNDWRLFHKLDAVIGNGIDLISELPWSNCEFAGEGLDGEIKDQCERAWDVCRIRSFLPYGVREHLVTGEACIQNFYSDNEGIWNYVALHNPDQLEVIYSPFVKMDPVVRFKPDNRLQQVLSSSSPMLQHVRESIPAPLLSALMSGQAIELSPLNFTFLPRKMHFYDVRGTSIISRMWEILMYQDAVYNASVAVARRAAAPTKVIKMGDPATGWIPDPSHFDRMLELLAQSELDPMAWICTHYATQFELIGIQERTWKIEQSAEYIERGKLMALGISKGFLVGEVTYACFPSCSPVYTPNGRVSIENVKVGDTICDRDGNHQTVVNAWNEGTPETLTEIELVGGKTLYPTHNHQWPAWVWPRICACGCKGPLKEAGQSVLHGHAGSARAAGVEFVVIDESDWGKRQIPTTYEPMQRVRSDELRVGDSLLIPRTFEEHKPTIPVQQARLLGYYVAEGSRKAYNATGRYCTDFSLCTDEKETLARDIQALCLEYGATSFTHIGNKNDLDCKRFYVTTATEPALDLQDWFSKHAGHDAKEKKLSAEVMAWPLEYKRELIRGAFLGDGSQSLSTSKYKGKVSGPYLTVSYETASEELAEQLATILIQLGFFVGVNRHARTDTRPGWPSNTAAWVLYIHSDAAMKLADLVWGEASLSKDVQRERNVRPTVRMDERYAYVPITSIRVVPNDKPVHNIEVTGSHSYLVDGFATYNSAASGLTIFLQRLMAIRELFESGWILPKFFRPMAVMNRWIKPTPAELSHGVRTRRSQRELFDDRRYIVPTLEWSRKLDPSVEQAQITAVNALQQLGVTFSKQYLSSLVGRDWEEELRQRSREVSIEQEIMKSNPSLAQALQPPGGAGGGGGGGGPPPGSMLPGMPPESLGFEAPPGGPPGGAGGGGEGGEGGGAPPPPEAGIRGDAGESGGPGGRAWRNPRLWSNGRAGNWDAPVVADLLNVFEGGRPEEDVWARMITVPSIAQSIHQDADGAWDDIELWLMGEGYPPGDIVKLEDILRAEGALSGTPRNAAAADFLTGLR